MQHNISSSLSNYLVEQLIITLSSQPFVSQEYTCQIVIKCIHSIQCCAGCLGEHWNQAGKHNIDKFRHSFYSYVCLAWGPCSQICYVRVKPHDSKLFVKDYIFW